MYICNDSVCDPCCDFCWYCIHGENGEPVICEQNEQVVDGGTGYCNKFKCRLYEQKPDDCGDMKVKIK